MDLRSSLYINMMNLLCIPGYQGHLYSSSLSIKDAIDVTSQRHRPHKVWRKRFSKLMVVGDAGLGKTTLIKTLLSIPGQKVQVCQVEALPFQLMGISFQLLVNNLI